MNFNEKLKVLRKERNITQEELAERLDVSRQAISKWELGEYMPEIDKIVALSKIYKVSLDYLLVNETDEQHPTEENPPQEIVKNNKFDKKFIVGIVLFAIGFAGILSLIIIHFVTNEGAPFWGLWKSKRLSIPFYLCCALILVGLLMMINIKAIRKAYRRQNFAFRLGLPLFIFGLIATFFSRILLINQTDTKLIERGEGYKIYCTSPTYESLPLFIISLVIALGGLVLLVIGIVKKARSVR